MTQQIQYHINLINDEKYFSIELDDSKAQYLYIPKVFAHGFRSLEDGTIVNYAQTFCYSQKYDCGIAQNSFCLDWGITGLTASFIYHPFTSPNIKAIDFIKDSFDAIEPVKMSGGVNKSLILYMLTMSSHVSSI